MDIFQSRFYSVNVTLLSLLGLWPHQKHKSWQLFQQIVCSTVVISVATPQIIKLLEIWGDFDIMIEIFTPVSVEIAAYIKFINGIVHRKSMMRLLKSIERDWSSLRNKREVEILMRFAEEGRGLTVMYTVFLYGATFSYLMIPMLPKFLDLVHPLNESRPHVFLYHTQYYVDPDEYFTWISLHTYSASMVTMTIVIAADGMFVCSVMHVCGILAVIANRLENLTPKRSDTEVGICNTSKYDDERCHREIVLCIDHHYRIAQVAKSIESSYSMSFLIILGMAVICLSLSAVQLLIKLGQTEEMIRLFQFNVAQCGHILFNSWPCQRLIDESVQLRESLYAAEWYSLSEENKNLLKFVMLRVLEPQKIVAGKIYLLSIENFGVVIKTSMSYFTVFASIR